jgi:hypothetical protein
MLTIGLFNGATSDKAALRWPHGKPLPPQKARSSTLFFPVTFAKRFERYIHADFVAELEAVGDRLGGAKDADFPSGNLPLLYAEMKRISGESDNPHQRRRDSRRKRSADDLSKSAIG